MKKKGDASLARIPQLGSFLERPAIRAIREQYGDGIVKFVVRDAFSEFRENLRRKNGQVPSAPVEWAELVLERVRRLVLPEGRKALNATGILLHTGLGRAPLSFSAVESFGIFSGYSVLQADVDTGKRSLREERVEKMLIELTGCEAATVVNNNAAATMLVLNTLSEGREAIISRGQLIEIGGQFRMPDVMQKSGAIMREVGTTNRTHLRDYEKAITESTGAIIHVHTSNYRIRGFSGTPTIAELHALRKKHPNLRLIDDLGSGALVPLSRYGIPDEPLVRDSLAVGADLVCFSGDKLICGPQSGIICGTACAIEQIRRNPFSRMFRVCKLTLAALEATLLHFINGTYEQELPFYQMLATDLEAVEKRASVLSAELGRIPGFSVEIGPDLAYVGSGSAPDEGIPSVSVRIHAKKRGTGFPEQAAGRLRSGVPSIFCRIRENALVFDMRTMSEPDFKTLVRELPERLKANG